MAERDSWAVATGIDQQDARMAVGALWTPGASGVAAKTGVRPGPGTVTPGTVYATATPDGFVHVQPFQAVLQTTRVSPGGPFILTLDAVKDINVLSTPANATNPRNDLIIAHQADTFYGDANSTMTVRAVVGTPSGTPADPSLAAFPDCLTLARVRVTAGATTITAGNVTDLRPAAPWTVAVGGIVPVPTQAARDSLVGAYDGYAVYRQDRDWVEIYDGAAWRVQGVGAVTSVADLAAITYPATGQLASNTADGLQYRYTGTAWRVVTYKASQTLAATAASVIFSGIPTYLRHLQLRIRGRSTVAGGFAALSLQVGGDGTAAYNNVKSYIQNGATTNGTLQANAAIATDIGYVPAATASAGRFGNLHVDITGWDAPTANSLSIRHEGGYIDTIANSLISRGMGIYTGNAAYTSLTVLTTTAFAIGSEFSLAGSE